MAKQTKSYTMTKSEKHYLLELLECDMRGSFPTLKDTRLKKALSLAKDLELEVVINDIEEFIKDGNFDGRWFRDSEHGFNYISTLHKEPRSIGKKSVEFKKYADELLRDPQYYFADYKNHKKGEY